jgi:hypothetical protein
MPALYGITSNANVSVSNTTGLYIGSGNVNILNSAGTLLNLLSNSGTVGFYSTNSGTQVAASVDPSGVTAGTYGSATLVPVITVGADGRITSVATIAPSTSSYGNANVAVYLAANTDPTISNLNANTQQQQLQINTISANLGAFETYANIYFANLQANSNTYSNANVASYLPIYSGTIGNTSSTVELIGSGVASYGATLTVGAFNQANINLGGSGSYASNVTIYKTDTTSFEGNTYILNYLPGGINAPTTTGGYLTVSNTATVGNIVTTGGVFWANGTVYSPTNTYGNTQVTALLASNTIPVNATSIYSTGTLYANSNNNTIFNAGLPTGAMAVPYGGVGIGLDLYVRGNILNLGTANIGNITTVSGVFWSNGQPYSSGSGTYGNANVAAYLPTYSGNLSPGNVLTNNYLYANSVSIFTGITSNAASLQTQINSTNANVTAANLTIANLSANVGAFETYANIYFANLQANSNTYSNANVASYLPVYTGNIAANNISVTNQTVSGNVKSTNGYYWANGVSYASTVSGTYSNANVASYLPIYSGNFGNVSSTINITGGTGSLQVGSTTGFSNVTIGGSGSYAGNVVLFATDINDYGNVYVLNRGPAFGSTPTTTGGYLTVSNTATVNALVTTTGVFWSNGAQYQPGGGGGTYGNIQVASFLPIYIGNIGGNLVNTLGSNANIQITTLGANAVIDAHSTKTGLSLPTGGNSQRPYNPWAGTIRYNSDIYAPEYWNGGAWILFTGNASPPVTTYTANYLIVAGGGSGGTGASGGSGGGGAGGLLTCSTTLTVGVTYNFVVGAGGAGYVSASTPVAINGANSTGFALTAIGGGGGGANSYPNYPSGGCYGFKAGNGGSGGGGWESGAPDCRQQPGLGTVGQGNAGGFSSSGTSGGGGGAGTAGGTGAGTTGGYGGTGLASSITGSSTYYAGGGGGTNYTSGTNYAPGGLGGGGAGSTGNSSYLAFSGTVNTGGGGGGASGSNSNYSPSGSAGASGGSGVIILSVPTTYYSGTTTGSPTITTSGSNTIIKYTASGSYTA